jgi:hypothetical protein
MRRSRVPSVWVRVKRSHKCKWESSQIQESSKGNAPKLWVLFFLKVIIHYFPCKSWTFSIVHWVSFQMNQSTMNMEDWRWRMLLERCKRSPISNHSTMKERMLPHLLESICMAWYSERGISILEKIFSFMVYNIIAKWCM